MANERILILDDDNGRHQSFNRSLIGYIVDHAYTAQEAIDMLGATMYDVVFLDHDLGGEVMVASGPGTGYEVAVWLAENQARCPAVVYVHSYNPAGAQNIKNALPQAILRPGAWS